MKVPRIERKHARIAEKLTAAEQPGGRIGGVARAIRCVAVAATLIVVALAAGSSARGSSAAVGAQELLVYVSPLAGSSGAHARLELVNRRGGVLRVLSTARAGTWAKWSPNDSLIAWVDPVGLHVEAADGSDPRLLVAEPGGSCKDCQQLSFLWSPDSRSLIVGSAGPNKNQLQRVPVDGHRPAVLLNSKDKEHWYLPDWWTPDGRLVYTDTRRVAITGATMKVVTPATGKTAVVWSTPNSQTQGGPIISPNLRYRAYIKQVDQFHQQLRIVDTRTGTSRVVRGVNTTNLVGWAPNSSALAVVERSRRLIIVTPSGGVSHTIGPAMDFFWGRDGELFVLREGGGRQICDSLDGHSEQFLFDAPKGQWVVSLDGN
jgi:hypothetical protein